MVDENPAKARLKACGAGVQIFPRAHIVGPERITIGDSVIIDDFVFLFSGPETRIGSFVHLASFSSYLGRGTLIIEDFVSISSGTRIYTGLDDFLGGGLVGPGVPEEFRSVERSFLHVKKYAIVGANSVVLPGVTIGEGAAVGALSLVNRDCEPWTVYAGTPARPIKRRRSDRIKELERDLRAKYFDEAGHYEPPRKATE